MSNLLFAGITYAIMRGRYAGLLRGPDTAAMTVFVRPLSFFSKQTVVTIISVSRQGPPSWVVRCLETNQIFTSQNQAAIEFGTSAANMSLHLRKKLPDIFGYHFERICLAA